MIAQLDLFEGIKDTKFPAFHEKNKHVYELFKVYTNKCIARGFKHISSDFIFHIMRWESNIDIKDEMNFKINNNYTPLYSRMFLNEYPHLAGFFRTRKSKYDNIVK